MSAKVTGSPALRTKIPGRSRRHIGELTFADRNVVTEFMRDFNIAETGARLGFVGDRQVIRHRVMAVLRRPEIRAEINRRLENKRQSAEATQARVIEELRTIAYANPLAACRVYDDDGNARFDVGILTKADMAAIASLEIDAKGKVKLKMHDKMDAIEKLGRWMKMFGAEAERLAPTTVRFVIEDSPRALSGDSGTRRIAGEVRIGHESDQSQDREAIVHVEHQAGGAGR